MPSYAWRFVVTRLNGRILGLLDRRATARKVTFTLGKSCVSNGTVAADNPAVNLVQADGFPILAEGVRNIYGFRSEGGVPEWVCRYAGRVLQIEDNVEESQGAVPYSNWTAYDPRQLLYTRPVLRLDGTAVVGKNGLHYKTSDGVGPAEIALSALQRSIDNNGDVGILTTGGVIETTGAIEFAIEQGTTVGELWDQLEAAGYIDIVLTPTYDPFGNPGALSTLSIYEMAGTTKYKAIFAWDQPGRSLVSVNRLVDGTQRANKIRYYAGQGGPISDLGTVSDADSITTYGEYWAQQFFPASPIKGAVGQLAEAALLVRSKGATTWRVAPAPAQATVKAPVPLLSYEVGDIVPIYVSSRFREQAAVLQRVIEIPIELRDDGTETVSQLGFSADGVGGVDIVIDGNPNEEPPPDPVADAAFISASGIDIGDVLTAEDNFGASTWQWSRCDASGASCSDLPGETFVNYTLTALDVTPTATIRVTEDGTVVSDYWSPLAAAALGSALPDTMPESSSISASPGDPNTVVMSVSGSDSNAGTVAAPVLTLSRALSLCSSGWVIFARSGSYGTQAGTHRFFSPLDPVTVRSYPGEMASFVGDTIAGQTAAPVQLTDSRAIRFRGITFASRWHNCVKGNNVWDLDFDGCVFRDVGRSMPCTGNIPSNSVPSCGWGIGVAIHGSDTLAGATQLGPSRRVQFRNSKFFNNGGHTTGWGGDIKHGHAAYLGGAGAQAGGGLDDFLVANCVFYDGPNGNVLQLGDSARNGFIVNCTFHNTDTRAIDSVGGLATYGSGSHIVLFTNSANSPKTGTIVIRNCIFKDAVGPAVYGASTVALVGVDVRNNLAHNCAYANDYSSATWSQFYGSTKVYTLGSNFSGDPLFADVSGAFGAAGKDLSVLPGSPALGKSDPAYTPATDITGASRSPTAPTLGAYE